MHITKFPYYTLSVLLLECIALTISNVVSFQAMYKLQESVDLTDHECKMMISETANNIYSKVTYANIGEIDREFDNRDYDSDIITIQATTKDGIKLIVGYISDNKFVSVIK